MAIPTYNRAESLRVVLDSIISQVSDKYKLEIIISDNASTDNTSDITKQYQEKYQYIKYFRNEFNKGIDYNISKAVELSSSDYVMLLSDDDLLLDGSLEHLISLINMNDEVSFFYINGTGFKKTFKGIEFFKGPVINNLDDIIFYDKNQFIKFLRYQITFVSAFLLHRKTWNLNTNKEQYFGTDIYLSYDLLHLLANSKKFMYIGKPLIGVHASYTPGNYRIFNAFAFQWRNLLLNKAIELGYDKNIMNSLFRQTVNSLKGRIKSIKKGNVNAKIDFQTWKLIFISTYDTPAFWLKLLPVLLTPSIIYIMSEKMKLFRRKIKKNIINWISK
jgi:abequosyltransferase